MRREEAAEAMLGCLLPGSRLTQCSHSDELVEPAGTSTRQQQLHTHTPQQPREPDTTALLCSLHLSPEQALTAPASSTAKGMGLYSYGAFMVRTRRQNCTCASVL